MASIDYIVVFAYLIGMIVIGLIAMKRVKGQEDFFMGGRGLENCSKRSRLLGRALELTNLFRLDGPDGPAA